MHFDWRITVTGRSIVRQNDIIKICGVVGATKEIEWLFNNRWKLNLITGMKYYHETSPALSSDPHWFGLETLTYKGRVYMSTTHKEGRPAIMIKRVKDKDKRFLYLMKGPYIDAEMAQ